MEALLNPCLSRLMWVAGIVVLLSSAASIAVVMAWGPISGHSVIPSSSAAPAPTVVTKAYTTILAPLISYPLGENMEMMALLDLHRYARSRVLTQGYKVTVLEDAPSCVFQKAVWNLAD